MLPTEYFKEEFQYEAVKALLNDLTLMPKIYGILDQNAFSDKSLRAVVATIKDYYKANGRVPDLVSLKIFAQRKSPNDSAEILSAIGRVNAASLVGQDAIEDELIQFFKLKYMVKMANGVIDSLTKNEDSDKVLKKAIKSCEEITKLGSSEGEETIFNEETVRRACMAGDNETVPTGIKELDYALYGGLGRGEIGLFAAPTGYGKTTAGVIFAHNAAVKGYKALQIYFEDKPDDMVRKHIGMSLNENTNNFRRMGLDEATDTSKKVMSMEESVTLSENLILCKMPDGTTTVEDIENKIKELINTRNFKPDLVVIDYFSSLKHSSNPTKDRWAAQASCMKKIVETIAYRYNAAVWIMQQTNRGAVSKEGDGAGMDNWQGSFEATQPASVWLTLKRSKEQKANFRADIIFEKTRHSQPKEDLKDIVFDNSRLQIDCSKVITNDERLEINNEYYVGYTGNDDFPF